MTHAYTYNDRGELTADAMSRGGTYSYAYDNIGNREMSREGTAVPTAYETNELNQYTSIGEGEQAVFVPEHDAAGNQTKIRTATGEWTVAYNALNQAVSFTQGDKRVECRYDYRGRRVEKSVYEGEALVARKRFLYRNYLQIAELDATDTTEESTPILRKTYLWDPVESSATRILAMSLFDEAGTYQEDLYYTHDLLKNTTALFGIQAGRRALYEYGPYGNVIKMEGNAAEQNPFRFSSEYADDEMGLIYYNYRYLNPMDGRWISRDPMNSIGSNNPYSFLLNKLLNSVDWIGLTKIDSTAKKIIEPANVVPLVYPLLANGSITNIKIEIKCCCKKLQETPPRFGIACRLIFDAYMDFSLDQARDANGNLTLSKIKGVFGHEQQHMVNSVDYMNSIDKELKNMDIDDFDTGDSAQTRATEIQTTYKEKIVTWLRDEIGHNHQLKNKEDKDPLPNSAFFANIRNNELPANPLDPRSWPPPTMSDPDNLKIDCP